MAGRHRRRAGRPTLPEMNWTRAHYERALVIAAAALLLVSALSILRKAVQFGTNFAAQQVAPPPKPATPPKKALELEAAARKFEQPPQWTFSGRSGAFRSGKTFHRREWFAGHVANHGGASAGA